jgi:hypothetical protein
MNKWKARLPPDGDLIGMTMGYVFLNLLAHNRKLRYPYENKRLKQEKSPFLTIWKEEEGSEIASFVQLRMRPPEMK